MRRRGVGLALLFALSILAFPPVPAQAPTVSLPPVGEPVARHDWTWTLLDERGLALGGGGLDAADVEDLRARGFGAVLNYRGEFPQEEKPVRDAGLEYLFLNNTYAEEDTMPLQQVIDAVAFIEENLDAGRPVYAHCTGGWHRSLVGPVAYFMKTRGWRYQEAYDHVAGIRPGVEPRYMDALLEYEAHLYGGEKLTVDMWTSRWDVEPNETMEVHVLVTHHGAPVEGAEVRYVSEYDRAKLKGTTDAQGRIAFPFVAVPGERIRFVSAQASKEGFVDGYDRNTFWVKEAKTRAPTEASVEAPSAPVAPGEEVEVKLRVQEADGRRANARFTLTTRCATLHRDYTGWDGTDTARFRAPEKEGTYRVLVHVNRFPAEPVFQTFDLVVGAGGPEPECVEREPVVTPSPAEPPSGTSEIPEQASAGGGLPPTVWAASALAGLTIAGLLLVLGRRRS